MGPDAAPESVPLLSNMSQPRKTYGYWACYSLTVNGILGVGILSLPHVYHQAGVLLSLVVMTIVTAVSALSVKWLVETSYRTAILARLPEETDANIRRHFRWIVPVSRSPRGSFSGPDAHGGYGTQPPPPPRRPAAPIDAEQAHRHQAQAGTSPGRGGAGGHSPGQPQAGGAASSLGRGSEAGHARQGSQPPTPPTLSPLTRSPSLSRLSDALGPTGHSAAAAHLPLAHPAGSGGHNGSHRLPASHSSSADNSVNGGGGGGGGGGGRRRAGGGRGAPGMRRSSGGGGRGEEICAAIWGEDPPLFNVSELCHFNLGLWAQRAYRLAMWSYILGSCWAFSVVFAASLTSHYPIAALSGQNITCTVNSVANPDADPRCITSYYAYLGVFACGALVLTVRDFVDQRKIQMGLTMWRYFALLAMVFTILLASGLGPFVGARAPPAPVPPDPDPGPEPPALAAFAAPHVSPSPTPTPDPAAAEGPPYWGSYKAWKPPAFHRIWSTAIFAQLIHFNIPGLMQPLKQRRGSLKVFYAALASTFFFYNAIGLLGAMYFGKKAMSVCTLDWELTGWPDSIQNAPWFSLIRHLIILFPVGDVLSAFPLYAIGLARDLHPLLLLARPRGSKRALRWASRLLAAAPPLVLAAVQPHFATTVDLTGLFGFFIAFVFPALLQIASTREWREQWVRRNRGSRSRLFSENEDDDCAYVPPVPYTSWLSKTPFAYAVIVLSIFGLAFSIGRMRRPIVDMAHFGFHLPPL